MSTISSKQGKKDPWYAVQCKPRMETYAAHMLQMIPGLAVFLPEYTLLSRKKEPKKVPLFPGYLFIQADLQYVAQSHINSKPGVIRLVTFTNEPTSVPDEIISLIQHEVANTDIKYECQADCFSFGDVVKVKDGPLQNIEMTFLGISKNQRVCVLLNILGRQKEVHVDASHLKKAR